MRRCRPLLGTLVEIRVPDGTGEQAIASAFAAIAQVHRLMSAQDKKSDVGRINRARAGARIRVHPWTKRVLRNARRISVATGGLFDCCPAAGNSADLEFLPGHAVRPRRPLKITLDGIAKGFAVDQAVAALRRAGVASGAVNAGGDLRVFGREAQPVYARDPRDLQRLVLIGELREAAVATSAAYFSGTPAIVHPRTRRAKRSAASVSVAAPDCMTADALTKAVFLDARAAARAMRRFAAQAVVLGMRAG
jgi:thiamine biosynthesis lipoprotein